LRKRSVGNFSDIFEALLRRKSLKDARHISLSMLVYIDLGLAEKMVASLGGCRAFRLLITSS